MASRTMWMEETQPVLYRVAWYIREWVMEGKVHCPQVIPPVGFQYHLQKKSSSAPKHDLSQFRTAVGTPQKWEESSGTYLSSANA